ncbi:MULTISPECIES: hypothetical protein [unclassified Roseobacter]|uniref:hypothetical protein n=1 Tax=unclassified Roseobacter TaxID=196798 RepID=UPI0030EBC2B1
MKHLLTAALIATALASPVRGESVYIECSDLGARHIKEGWTLYPDTMLVTYEDVPMEFSHAIIKWTDEIVAWTWSSDIGKFVFTYVLDLETMQMLEAYVTNLRVLETRYQCTRPL